jgi:hypothetical protein
MALRVRYREMAAILWDGSESAFADIAETLKKLTVSESVRRTDLQEGMGGPDAIHFWLRYNSVMNYIIPRGSYLVIAAVPGAAPIILRAYDFHAQFVELD